MVGIGSTNSAGNSTGRRFSTARKRCNSNAVTSWFERVATELHAKLVVGPGRASRRHTEQRPGPTGVEGAGGIGGPGCGARGRWRGLAGLRDDAPSEARGADGERAGRRPRAHKAARPDESGPPAPETPVGPQAALRNWAASRPTARSTKNAILQSPGRPRCRRRNAPRALPGRNR